MESMFFDPESGTFRRRAPTVEEFSKDPSKYPGYVLFMKNDTGVLHVMTHAEAKKDTRQDSNYCNECCLLLLKIDHPSECCIE